MTIYIGIDFGGTKIEAAAMDGKSNMLASKRVFNPGEYTKSINAIKELINDLLLEVQENDPSLINDDYTVGVAMPGTVSPRTNTLINANTTYLNGLPFKKDLEEVLGKSVRLANDANCLALSEALDGAAYGAFSVFAVILGTGCGGGLVFDGQLLHGSSGLAGEWGHSPLPWPTIEEVQAAAPCWCGQKGCIETWISGTGLAREFNLINSKDLKAHEIFDAARNGDEQAKQAIKRLVNRLGRGLAAVINTYDPDVIVFGGGLSLADEIYDGLMESIQSYVFGQNWQGRIEKAIHGDASGVRGAAYLWRQQSDLVIV